MAQGPLRISRPAFRLGLVALFSLLVFLGDTLGLFEGQELGFLDLRFRVRGETWPDSRLAIVEIDDACISRLGEWPWPRSYHAKLIKTLAAYKPLLIVYDVLFTEAGPDPNEDTELARAIEQAGNVILPFFYHSEQPFLAFFPLNLFREPARGLGFVNIFPDRDGRIRRMRRSIHPLEGPHYPLSVLAVLTGFREEEKSQDWLKRIPVDRENSFWINYPGHYARFTRVPFYEVLEKKGGKDPQLKHSLQGKIVFVGMTATGGADLRPTPFAPAYPGIGIQAASLHTLLTGRHLRYFNGPITLLMLLGFAFGVAWVTWKNPPPVGLAAVLTLTLLYLVWNFLIFDFLGWLFPVFSVLTVLLGTYVLALFLQYVQIRFEGELFRRELSLAASIQENFLPQQSPRFAGGELAFECRFARVVGGDLYDWVSLGDGRLGVCVGDVSGKGMPAAIYMARAISEFRALAGNYASTAELLKALNARLVPATGQGLFVTLVYLILDAGSQSVAFSNAGHEPLLVYRSWTRKAEWIREGAAQPLGIFLDVRYPEKMFSLEGGDSLVLMSDGVRELRNAKGEEFGPDRVERILDSLRTESAAEIVKGLFGAMDDFAKGVQAQDDRTVICLKLEPPEQKGERK